jgi:hypothetical protein
LIDADPNTDGIQTEIEVQPADSVAIDVRISGIDEEPENGLHAFELDLTFDKDLLETPVLEAGDFLGEMITNVCNASSSPPGVVCVRYVRSGSEGVTGSGTVATVTFHATKRGRAALSLEEVILSRPFGVEILEVETQGASIAVPEPGGARLTFAALMSLFALARQRRSAGLRFVRPGRVGARFSPFSFVRGLRRAI